MVMAMTEALNRQPSVLDSPAVVDVIARLLSAGQSPTALALALDVDFDSLIAVAPEHVQQRVKQDEVLSEGLRRLLAKSIIALDELLEEGTPIVRAQIAGKVTSALGGTFAKGAGDEMQELREQFMTLAQQANTSPPEPSEPSSEPE